MKKTIGYAARHSISELRPQLIDRRDPAANEVSIEIDKGHADFRYVIDMATLRGKQEDESLLAKIGL